MLHSAYCIRHEAWGVAKHTGNSEVAANILAGGASSAPALFCLGKPSSGPDMMLDCHVIRFMTTFLMIGRHLADAFGYWDLHEVQAWGNAFVIPAFSFISGVFNANAASSSVLRIWSFAAVACFFSLLTHVLAAVALSMEPISVRSVFLDRVTYYWFLPCLLAWRYAIVPFGSAMRARQVSAAVPFALIFVVCYLGRHFFASLYDGPVTAVFIWNRAFAFAPFFAAGALFPREIWHHLIVDLRLQVAGTIFFAIWHMLLFSLPRFRHWNVTACIEPAACEFHSMGGHFPLAGLYRPYSLHGMFMDITIYAMMLPVTLAVLWMAGGAVALTAPLLPRSISRLASCGAYALVALVLHVPLVELASLMHVQLLMREVPGWLHFPLVVLVALHMTIALASDGTANLLRKLPFAKYVLPADGVLAPS